MSIKIRCKYCGLRPVEEFYYGEVPEVPEEIKAQGEEAYEFDFGYMRKNTEGVQTEAWFHAYGCRRWTYVQRNTVTDAVVLKW
ncbi:MAG: sarcosine oxidase subunit delta [Chloroflexota bacterium]